MKIMKAAGILVVGAALVFVGGALGQGSGRLMLDVVSTSEWSKTGTGTTFKVTRIKDADAKITCYIMDVGSREQFSCVKD